MTSFNNFIIQMGKTKIEYCNLLTKLNSVELK
jgi:hypothetical protein